MDGTFPGFIMYKYRHETARKDCTENRSISGSIIIYMIVLVDANSRIAKKGSEILSSYRGFTLLCIE